MRNLSGTTLIQLFSQVDITELNVDELQVRDTTQPPLFSHLELHVQLSPVYIVEYYIT